LLDGRVSALIFRLAALAVDAGLLSMLASREARNDASSSSGRSWLRTDERKFYADDRDFACEAAIVGSPMKIQIHENIHAKYPPCATVAPILHVQARDKATNRSITFNQWSGR
jgi:hypothetical protein